jgi:hypothetical protein
VALGSLLFSFDILSEFGVRVVLALWNELENDPSSSVYWKSLMKIGIQFSLNVW